MENPKSLHVFAWQGGDTAAVFPSAGVALLCFCVAASCCFTHWCHLLCLCFNCDMVVVDYWTVTWLPLLAVTWRECGCLMWLVSVRVVVFLLSELHTLFQPCFEWKTFSDGCLGSILWWRAQWSVIIIVNCRIPGTNRTLNTYNALGRCLRVLLAQSLVSSYMPGSSPAPRWSVFG